MMPIGFYPMSGPDLVLMILPMLIGMWAQMKVKGAYGKYSQIGSRSGLTGADVPAGSCTRKGFTTSILRACPAR